MKKMILGVLAVCGSIFAASAETTAPSFPGGEEACKEFVAKNLKYPAMAKENGVEGVVNVGFIVKTDGSIGTIKILRMIDPDLEQEAIRIVKAMPAWIPATDNGKPVDAPANVSIDFSLE